MKKRIFLKAHLTNQSDRSAEAHSTISSIASLATKASFQGVEYDG